MESPRKFNDCYFYYYSTCTKGDNCVFRHEPSALGCETMCSAWQQGKCLDKRCKLRHMELRKNRKQIPCYWETQPGGCRKKHCSFMHKNPDARTDGIAPSQPGPPLPLGALASPELVVPGELGPVVPVPAPAPMPALWQQQRHVELDSAILRVMPAGGVGPAVPPRRDGPHEQVAPYPISVDPFFVSFEEESDNESTPSSTPTKPPAVEDESRVARSKSQELVLLERIQAEAAAFYSYDSLPPAETMKDRKINRTNLSTKYDRLSVEDIAGKAKLPSAERRKSLDFKVLSLDEIRAKKKSTDTEVQHAPIQLNLSSRKRKISTQESVTTSGNKIIKVVRSNSIVYKKFDKSANTAGAQSKLEESKQSEVKVVSRKRTLSEMCADIYDMQDDELVDDCYEFKRVEVTEQITKPKLIRTRLISEKIDSEIFEQESLADNRTDNESDLEVQILDDEVVKENEQTNLIEDLDCEIIELDTTKANEQIEVVDLSDDDDVTETIMGKNVPDIVASCRKNTTNKNDDSDLDVILYDEI